MYSYNGEVCISSEVISNGTFLSSFAFCKYVAMTHAVPGQGGHHHVNCQPREYWIEHMARFGFEFDEEITNELKELADEGTHYKSTGLFFRKID